MKRDSLDLLPGFANNSVERSYPLLDILLKLTTLKSFSLLTSMLSLFQFRFHLFVWSVFAPKFLYEVSHFLILTIFTTSAYLFTKFSR